jgi:hypothetical protein
MDYLLQKKNLKGREYLEELGVYKMIILKRVLKKLDGRV